MLKHRPKYWIALVALAAMAGPACNTGAVGVEECRRIESARCEAAPSCPDQFKLSDVGQCKLFYRDQCLHGLPLATAPSASSVNACIDAIKDLAKCASDLSPKAAVADCGGNSTSTKTKITNVCKLMAAPEAISDCAFLAGDTSAGGQSSTGGQSSGGSANGGSSENGAGGTNSSSTDQLGIGGLTELLGIGGLTL